MNLTAHSTTLRLARCLIGRDHFLIDLGGVASIQQSNVVTQIPTAEQPVGRLDTKQGTIPVYSMAFLLSGEFAPVSLRAYCLIVNRNGRRWGLMVDQIQQSFELPHDRLMPLPSDLQNAWCLGAALLAEQGAPSGQTNSPAQQTQQLLLVLNPAAFDGQAELKVGCRSRSDASDRLSTIPSTQSVSSVRQLVLFDLSSHRGQTARTALALNAAQVMEITGPQSIASLPMAPQGVLGLIEWRGHAVPLLNLSTRLGLPDHVATRLTRIVIVRRPFSDDHIAFLAPSSIRTHLLLKNQTTRRDDLNPDTDRFFGAFAIGNETLLVPDLDQIFTSHGNTVAAV